MPAPFAAIQISNGLSDYGAGEYYVVPLPATTTVTAAAAAATVATAATAIVVWPGIAQMTRQRGFFFVVKAFQRCARVPIRVIFY